MKLLHSPVHLLPKVQIRQASRNGDPCEHCDHGDGLKVRQGEGAGDVEHGKRNADNADDAVGDVPGVFVTHCPWQSEAGVAGKWEFWRYDARKYDDACHQDHGEKFFTRFAKMEHIHFDEGCDAHDNDQYTNIHKGGQAQDAEAHVIGGDTGKERQIPIEHAHCHEETCAG